MNKKYQPFKNTNFVFETTPEHSARLSEVKNTNTKPELLLRKKLWSLGIRYRINTALKGKPDIVINKYKIAIFVDGEFWHGYNWSSNKEKIKSNRAYWIPKIEKNIARDTEINSILESQGYYVVRIWENRVKKELDCVIEQILDILKDKKIEKNE